MCWHRITTLSGRKSDEARVDESASAKIGIMHGIALSNSKELMGALELARAYQANGHIERAVELLEGVLRELILLCIKCCYPM